MLAYEPAASESDPVCPICRALGYRDVEPHERIDRRTPHLHVVPSTEDAGLETLATVLSHTSYENVVEEYEDSLDEIEATLDGDEGSWSEIQQLVLTLRNTADGLEVLHAATPGGDRGA